MEEKERDEARWAKYHMGIRIHLGTKRMGELRKAALEMLAFEAGCVWGGRPSIGRWVVSMADRKLEELGLLKRAAEEEEDEV